MLRRYDTPPNASFVAAKQGNGQTPIASLGEAYQDAHRSTLQALDVPLPKSYRLFRLSGNH